MDINEEFKVLCKSNYYEPIWGYLAYRMGRVYKAEIIVGDKKDTIWVEAEPGISATFFSFKKFAEFFKILDEEDLWEMENKL